MAPRLVCPFDKLQKCPEKAEETETKLTDDSLGPSNQSPVIFRSTSLQQTPHYHYLQRAVGYYSSS